MQGILQVEGEKISYELSYKNVKNINLRIKADGSVWISAPRRSSQKQLDAFFEQRGHWILTHVQNRKEHWELVQGLPEKPVLHDVQVFFRLFEQVYEQFREVVPEKPILCIRTMKTRWGSCMPQKGKITLNRELLKAHENSIIYVLTHEFVHFLHPNHSKDFYLCLAQMMSDYKEQKKFLEEQGIL